MLGLRVVTSYGIADDTGSTSRLEIKFLYISRYNHSQSHDHPFAWFWLACTYCKVGGNLHREWLLTVICFVSLHGNKYEVGITLYLTQASQSVCYFPEIAMSYISLSLSPWVPSNLCVFTATLYRPVKIHFLLKISWMICAICLMSDLKKKKVSLALWVG